MRELFSTIAAISTPPGKGGVAIIRLSGAQTLEVIEKCFKPLGNVSPSRNTARLAVYGNIIKDGRSIDDVLCTFFPAPHSYTGEDMAEISCHGGILITKAVLEAVLLAGAVPAEAGEFTRRAFICGKLSLSEAEAIGMLLEAKSESQLELFSGESRAVLAEKISEIRTVLTSLMSSIYARIDYPDEDLGDFGKDECVGMIEKAEGLCQRLSQSYKTGHAISEGIECAIVGLPNAGKSTLYNALTGGEYAIVTDIAGTTRDLLMREISLGGVLIRLTDTAGIRECASDPIEKIGVERSLRALGQSELIFALFDSKSRLTDEEAELVSTLRNTKAKIIPILTKCDGGEADADKLAFLDRELSSPIKISAKEDPERACEILSEIVKDAFLDGDIEIRSDAIISTARQNAAVTEARERLRSAKEAFLLGLPEDICSSDISLALSAISQLDGRAVSEEIVKDIFSKFCVGK